MQGYWFLTQLVNVVAIWASMGYVALRRVFKTRRFRNWLCFRFQAWGL